MKKDNYYRQMKQILSTETDTYDLFNELLYEFDIIGQIEFLEFLKEHLTEERIQKSGREMTENLMYLKFDPGTKYDVPDPDEQKSLIISDKGRDITRIIDKIPVLLSNLKTKRKIEEEKDNETKREKKIEYIKLSSLIKNRNDFIRDFYKELQKISVIDENVTLIEFENHFEKSYTGKKMSLDLGLRPVSYLFRTLKYKKYITNTYPSRVIYENFSDDEGKEFNWGSLRKKYSELNTIINTKSDLPNFERKTEVQDITKYLIQKYPIE